MCCYKKNTSLNLSSPAVGRLICPILLIFLFSDVTKLGAQDTDQPSFTCTQVIGFSQVGQPGLKDQLGPGYGWYMAGGVFESIVDDARWQLLWEGGAAVNRWADPEYEGWDKDIISPCNTDSDAPDRVLLSVSGLYGDNLKAWTSAIEKALETIRQKLPSVETIILQPVVGGPGGKTCSCMRNCDLDWPKFPDPFENVLASRQHKYIEKAIDQVVANQKQGIAVRGYSPQLESCSHYIDGIGHLTKQGAAYVGKQLGNYYK